MSRQPLTQRNIQRHIAWCEAQPKKENSRDYVPYEISPHILSAAKGQNPYNRMLIIKMLMLLDDVADFEDNMTGRWRNMTDAHEQDEISWKDFIPQLGGLAIDLLKESKHLDKEEDRMSDMAYDQLCKLQNAIERLRGYVMMYGDKQVIERIVTWISLMESEKCRVPGSH
ncbi:Protein of unknown function [Pyronema omphalodes CBS 100304]|uniref:Uncharacterized protein n=1 Tax=Pyronema omphalodes (strain CBS 100304) TaxID=1076935 RepID=U4LNM1_PYROM|nr:Protein of unknown function [Pyronema omphalodes CBS 100304]